MNNGLVTNTVFIDLEESFDTVDYEILLSKLEYYTVCDESLPWLKTELLLGKKAVGAH